jgi:hypothetical protein
MPSQPPNRKEGPQRMESRTHGDNGSLARVCEGPRESTAGSVAGLKPRHSQKVSAKICGSSGPCRS